MTFHQTTQVPNILFDTYLPLLTEAELKLLLVIIRQTNGWIDKRTGRRKSRVRISHGQFMTKTALSRRVISKALQSLVSKGLISITCHGGNLLNTTESRRGKTSLFYSLNLCTWRPKHVHLMAQRCAQSAHNKRNYTKETNTKLREGFRRENTVRQIGEIIKSGVYSSYASRI